MSILGLGGTTVELMNWEGVPVGPKADPESEHLGYRMMAVEVDDMKQALAYLAGKGIEPAWGPVSATIMLAPKSATPTAIASSCATVLGIAFGAGRVPGGAWRFVLDSSTTGRLLLRDAALSGDRR